MSIVSTNKKDKVLLVIGAGIESIPGIKLAQDMGLFVVATDGNKNAPGLLFADDKIIVSTYAVEETVNLVKEYNRKIRKIDGVICIASDVPVPVARVAKELNLFGISVEAAKLATDKFAMKERLKKDLVPIPWFSKIKNLDELYKIIEEKNAPLILKPFDSRGARGVFQIDKTSSIKTLFSESKKASPTGRIMVEEYLQGPQLSTESILINNTVHTIGISDRNYEYLDKYHPHIIENGGDLPSHIDRKMRMKVDQIISKAAKSLGIINGIVKGDLVITNGNLYIIEIAARLSGGYFCSHKIPLNTGVNLVEAAIKQVLGEELNQKTLLPKVNIPVAQRYWFPDPGIVKSIDDIEKYTGNKNVKLLEIRVKPGDLIGKINSHPSRAGVVITTGKNKKVAIKLAEEIVKNIQIKTEPINSQVFH